MKVVHIGPSEIPVVSDFGGAVQRRMFELAKQQAAGGHEVVVFSPDTSDGEEVIDQVLVRSISVTSRRPMRDYEFLMKARKIAGPGGDVLHAHGSPDAARVLGRPFDRAVQTVDYFRYRLTSSRLGRAYYALSLDRYDGIICVSDFCAMTFREFYPDVRSSITVIPNGVDVDRFRPDLAQGAQATSELDLPQSDLVVYLGRVCEQKGSDLLAPLARRLATSNPAAKVVAVGPANQFGSVGKSELMLELESSGVACTGAVPERLLVGVLNAASVVVLPTRQNEMFGMAAAEALACGTPVVASNIGGLPQAVGDVGTMFEMGDVEELHRGVAELLGSQTPVGLRQRCVEHAAQFAWPRVAAQTMDFYASL